MAAQAEDMSVTVRLERRHYSDTCLRTNDGSSDRKEAITASHRTCGLVCNGT